MIAYILAGYDLEPAVRVLRQEGIKHDWPEKSATELGALVEIVFGTMQEGDPAGLVALTDTDNPSDEHAMRHASRVLEEWRLYKWGLPQNVARGVAASSRAMLQELARDRYARGHAAPHARGTTAMPGTRMFMTRFRRRWGGRFGASHECYDNPQDERVAKVCAPHPS